MPPRGIPSVMMTATRPTRSPFICAPVCPAIAWRHCYVRRGIWGSSGKNALRVAGSVGGPKGSLRSEASGAEAPVRRDPGRGPEGPLFHGALARPRLQGADLRWAFPRPADLRWDFLWAALDGLLVHSSPFDGRSSRALFSGHGFSAFAQGRAASQMD